MKSQRLLSNAEIASFCSQTAMILNAGITPYEGMSILMQDTKDEKGKALVNTIIESLGQGETFYKWQFPLFMLGPIVGAVLYIVFISFVKDDKAHRAAVEAALKERRAAAAAAENTAEAEID